MDDFESKLGQILGNPEMMGKIMSMAQSFGAQEAPPSPEPQKEESFPELDFAAIQKLTGLMGKECGFIFVHVDVKVSVEHLNKMDNSIYVCMYI